MALLSPQRNTAGNPRATGDGCPCAARRWFPIVLMDNVTGLTVHSRCYSVPSQPAGVGAGHGDGYLRPCPAVERKNRPRIPPLRIAICAPLVSIRVELSRYKRLFRQSTLRKVTYNLRATGNGRPYTSRRIQFSKLYPGIPLPAPIIPNQL